MQKIIDFSDCPYSDRHGYYGGQAGDKDGIIYDGEYWIIKYPKSARYLKNVTDISYVTSPLSEYIGSHVYEILGYETHETLLGIRNNKIVVACKDFCKYPNELMEIRTIKNAANRELSDVLEKDFSSSSTGDRVNLNELLLHFEYNRILKNVNGGKSRFWDMTIVDILIGNNDRNNGNWGLLPYGENKMLSPIYDNGNSFNSKTSDEKIKQLYSENKVKEIACGNRTAFDYNNHTMSAKKLIKLDNEDLKESIINVVPLIENKMEDIKSFIESIPESYNGYDIISKIRKNFYIDEMRFRLDDILIPAFKEIAKTHNQEKNYGIELE